MLWFNSSYNLHPAETMYKSVLFVDLHEKPKPSSGSQIALGSNYFNGYPATSSPNLFWDSNPNQNSIRRSSVSSQLSDFVNVNEPEDDLMYLSDHRRLTPLPDTPSPTTVSKKHVTFKIPDRPKIQKRNGTLPKSYQFSEAVVSPFVINSSLRYPRHQNPAFVIDRRSPALALYQQNGTVKASNGSWNISLSSESPTSSPPLVKNWVMVHRDQSPEPIMRSASTSSNYDNVEPQPQSSNRTPKIRSPMPLAKITESVAQKSFDGNQIANRNRFRPLTAKNAMKYSQKFDDTDTPISDSELPRMHGVKSWRTPSPKPVLFSNRVSRTRKLALDGPASNGRSTDSDSGGSPRRSKTVAFKPMIPLRVMTPTFEDIIKLPRRNRTSANAKKDLTISLPDPTIEIAEGIETRPKGRNYSAMNRPATQGQTEVYFRRNQGQHSARSNTISGDLKKSGGNFEQLTGSGTFNSSKGHRDELNSKESILYSSLTDLQQTNNENSPQSSSSPDLGWRSQTKNPDYNMLLQKVDKTANQNQATNTVNEYDEDLRPNNFSVKLQYIVMQEKINGCSPLIASEEKLVDFFVSTQNGDHSLLISKIKINKDGENRTFFNYQVNQHFYITVLS